MLAELKMVVHDRLLFTQHHFEPVKPVDPLAALRLRIETLTTLTGSVTLSKTNIPTFLIKSHILMNSPPMCTAAYD